MKQQITNSIRIGLIFLLIPIGSFGQTSQNDIVGMSLDNAETLLKKRGFEIAASSFFKKEQLWYNETENECISLTFNKKGDHEIKEVSDGDVEKCKSGLAAARKIMESYNDGPAPDNAMAIEKEREKLIAKGFVVSYWVKDVAPGRTSEYWKNESSGSCMFIVWNTADQTDVSSSSCDANYRNNPYPKLNN